MAHLTFERAIALLEYDCLTGIFRWRVDHNKMKAGDIAGGFGAGGYWMIGVDGGRYYGHRLAWLIMAGEWPSGKVDHKDTDRTNNVWENLRPATSSQNLMNSVIKSTNKSGFKGVSWAAHCSKWQAHIRIDGRSTYLGLYENPADAHAAYAAASREFHGEYGRVA